MLRAWRERDQEKRIKTAHQALEHNSRYAHVLCRKPVFLSMVVYSFSTKTARKGSRQNYCPPKKSIIIISCNV